MSVARESHALVNIDSTWWCSSSHWLGSTWSLPTNTTLNCVSWDLLLIAGLRGSIHSLGGLYVGKAPKIECFPPLSSRTLAMVERWRIWVRNSIFVGWIVSINYKYAFLTRQFLNSSIKTYHIMPLLAAGQQTPIVNLKKQQHSWYDSLKGMAISTQPHFLLHNIRYDWGNFFLPWILSSWWKTNVCCCFKFNISWALIAPFLSHYSFVSVQDQEKIGACF